MPARSRPVKRAALAACVSTALAATNALGQEEGEASRPAAASAPPGAAAERGAAEAPRPPANEEAPKGNGDAEAGGASKTDPSPDPPLAKEQRRPVPDYDGRGDEPTTFGDVAIWFPRILLGPLYLVSEFVVRRPLGLLVTAAEKNHLPALFVDFFTFGPERNIGVIPTGLIDFGFRPSIGLYFFYNDFIATDNDLRLRGAWGGANWLMFTGVNRVHFGDGEALALKGTFERRPDWVFYGLGPTSSIDDEARFKKKVLGGELRYARELRRSSSFSSAVGVRDVEIEGGRGCCDDITVNEALARGLFDAPPGLNDSYTVLYQRLELNLDSRRRRKLDDPRPGSDFVSPPGTGMRLSLRGEYATNVRRAAPVEIAGSTHQSWLRYGGTLGGFVDLTGQQRVAGLMLVTEFADPISDGTEIPFTEQVRLGGPFVMRGMLEGRLVGRSAAVARFVYQWPIWVWLDGAAFYEAGNVFGERLEGFEFGLLRGSFGLGIRGTGKRDHVFETLLAFGTETFDDGHGVENVRFVFGATSGF